MMSVVEDMGLHEDQGKGQSDLSWEDAAAEWDAGEEVELERPHRKITIQYRYVDGRFIATSPDLTGFEVTGPSLYETTQLVRADLQEFLDNTVELDERMPRQEQNTEGASRQVMLDSSSLVLQPASQGRNRAFVSPSPLRVRGSLCRQHSCSATSRKQTRLEKSTCSVLAGRC